jgi:hypothetical protein
VEITVMTSNLSRSSFWTALALVVTSPLLVSGATPKSRAKTEAPAPAIGLFEGLAAGEIEVAIIPKDSTEATITVKNKSNKPLTIKMPEALAAVPVFAQAGGLGGGGMGGMGGGGMGGGGGGGGMQSMGMGGGGMGGGMGGMGGGMGGGMFNVAPDRVAKVKLPGVCLEHGLKDPNPRVPYKLVSIESFAKSPAVVEVLKMLGRGELDQHSAQAATWHLQNDLSWEELANKIGAKHLNGSVEPYFTAAHLQRAHAIVRVAEERARTAPPILSPSDKIARHCRKDRRGPLRGRP